MVRRLRWIGYFISVLSVVLFGLVALSNQKASAISLSTNVLPTGRVEIVNKNNIRCIISDLNDPSGRQVVASVGNLGECILGTNNNTITLLENWYVNTPINVVKGNYYNVLIGYQTTYNLNSVVWHPSVPTNGIWQMVEMTEISTDEAVSGCNRWAPASTPSGFDTDRICQFSYNNTEFTNESWKTKWWSVTLMALNDSNDAYFFLGNQNRTPRTFLAASGGQVFMSNITEYSPSDKTAQILEQDKTESEQQGQQSEGDSDQAGQDVEGATTNLLSAITGFFGAFTSASATTCQTDWGIEGFRNFDFCGTQVPAQLQVIFTIVASIIFIPMIWFLITSILNAFKEFQQ